MSGKLSGFFKRMFSKHLPPEETPHDPILDADAQRALRSHDPAFIESVRDRWGKHYGDDMMYHAIEYHRMEILADEREIDELLARLKNVTH